MIEVCTCGHLAPAHGAAGPDGLELCRAGECGCRVVKKIFTVQDGGAFRQSTDGHESRHALERGMTAHIMRSSTRVLLAAGRPPIVWLPGKRGCEGFGSEDECGSRPSYELNVGEFAPIGFGISSQAVESLRMREAVETRLLCKACAERALRT